MGVKNPGYAVKRRERLTVNLAGVAGNYGDGRITFGQGFSGVVDEPFLGVTVLIEEPAGGPPGGVGASAVQVELWLPRQVDASEAASARDPITDYFPSGLVCLPAGFSGTAPTGQTVSYGSATWPLAGYSGGQIRVKDGGVAGAVTISMSAW